MNTELIKISSGIPNADYPIIVGMDLGENLVEQVRIVGENFRVAIVSDDIVGERWGKTCLDALSKGNIDAELFTFPHGEQHKQQNTVTLLQEKLLEKHYGRDTSIVALGGGVVGDIAGYVAATYLRGVPYIQMPTTLLSMVDSSIGGKVGIDTAYGKNTVGAFWQPSAVLADLRFLESLPTKEVMSGLLEAIKTFFTSDKDALPVVDRLNVEKPLVSPLELQEIIVRSIKIKTAVVARDEREENERRILNFGHTVGHAIELLSGYALPHGFAVGYGMLVETKIAEDSNVLSPADRATVCSYLDRFGITVSELQNYAIDDVLEAMKGDKKARGGAIYCVLLSGIGSIFTKDGEYAHPVGEDAIRNAYESLAHA